MLATTILKKKPFPAFIKNHKVFKTVKTIKKIFPEIGLENCEQETEIDNKESIMDAAKDLIWNMKGHLRGAMYYKDHLFAETAAAIDNNCIVWKDGAVSLNLRRDVSDATGKVVFKAGERLFRVYNKLLTDSRKQRGYYVIIPLENLHGFKRFSSVNIPSANKKFKICFSSDGMNGLWDIATMSMRGITSCQRWNAPESKHLIGTMVDPFTGIIYLTSGTDTTHGSKMIRRSTVKFIVSKKSKRPSIGIERMYPDHDLSTMKAFISFIKEKTDNKFDVIDLYHTRDTAFVPMSDAVSQLSAINTPYVDSDVCYGNSEGVGVKQERMVSRWIEEQILAAFRTIDTSKLKTDDQKRIKSFQAKTRSNKTRHELYQSICDMVIDNTYESCNMRQLLMNCKDSFDYCMIHDIMSNVSYHHHHIIRAPKLFNFIAKLAHKNISTHLDKEIAKLTSKTPKKLPKNAPIYMRYV